VTVQEGGGEGKGETMATTPSRLDWFVSLSGCMFKYRKPLGKFLLYTL
jgi:hypothetical protein